MASKNTSRVVVLGAVLWVVASTALTALQPPLDPAAQETAWGWFWAWLTAPVVHAWGVVASLERLYRVHANAGWYEFEFVVAALPLWRARRG